MALRNPTHLETRNGNSNVYNLIIDIGNSSAKAAIFEGNNLLAHTRAEHTELPSLLAHKTKECPIRHAIVSTVIPLDETLTKAIETLPCPCLQMSTSLKMPFRITYKTPETLGPDRLAAVAGAWSQKPGQDLLIIDMGTAITYDLLTAEGTHLGGNISPGIGMRLKALNHFTGKLPLVKKEGERVVLGNTTETAIREGVLQGVDWEIEGYIRTYTLKYPKLLTFLTGGNAFLLGNQTKSRIFADDLLVLKGLNCILTLNNEKI